jgi:DNA-binding NtrC family response regulator
VVRDGRFRDDLYYRLKERELILDALKNFRGNMTRAAKALGITERIMGLRVKKYGIDPRRFRHGDRLMQPRGCNTCSTLQPAAICAAPTIQALTFKR